ncbi:uncharacterized protein LOC131437080 [Malaya genurostris]|uniref:uncharacterized protein LOC131437080 n=1 Tax=Malaya genurostris TaxID=325434 RepID=UPI0026F3FAA8|nr:uncharacterized protein LOC131437080 [Malaya genurostris]
MSTDNFSIVQITENGHVLLSVLPSRWVRQNGWEQKLQEDGADLYYWPNGVVGYRLLENAKLNPQVIPDTAVLNACQCKIKRTNIASYADAFRELELMERHSDPDEYERRKGSSTISEGSEHIQTKPGSSLVLSKSVNDQQDNHISESLPEDGSGSKPSMLQNADTDEPSIRQLLLSLHKKMDENSKQIEALKKSHQSCMAALAQINAKLDTIGTKTTRTDTSALLKPDTYVSKKIPLTPVKCLDDMESLEIKSKNEDFVQSVVLFLGSMHGKHRYVGEGTTVCLQVINYFFEREFLINCSWSGISRSKKTNGSIISKIPFHKFSGVIDMFYRVVLFSDPTFSKVQCEQFLHRCLRNAKQRFEEIKGIRASVARKRRKRSERDLMIQMIPEGIGTPETEEFTVEEYPVKEESPSPSPTIDEGMNDEMDADIDGYFMKTE